MKQPSYHSLFLPFIGPLFYPFMNKTPEVVGCFLVSMIVFLGRYCIHSTVALRSLWISFFHARSCQFVASRQLFSHRPHLPDTVQLCLCRRLVDIEAKNLFVLF